MLAPCWTKLLGIVCLCLLAIGGLAAAASDDVVINEIHYNPEEDLASEFIEIHNKGEAAIDLGGWRLSDAVNFTFPPLDLAAGAYAVRV